jgi:hypothetical protein
VRLVVEIEGIADQLVDVDFRRALEPAAVATIAAIASVAARSAALATIASASAAFAAAAFTRSASAFAGPIFTGLLLLFLRFRHLIPLLRGETAPRFTS